MAVRTAGSNRGSKVMSDQILNRTEELIAWIERERVQAIEQRQRLDIQIGQWAIDLRGMRALRDILLDDAGLCKTCGVSLDDPNHYHFAHKAT
jgi:hypothetical protein